jgi:hypothetical protein
MLPCETQEGRTEAILSEVFTLQVVTRFQSTEIKHKNNKITKVPEVGDTVSSRV